MIKSISLLTSMASLALTSLVQASVYTTYHTTLTVSSIGTVNPSNISIGDTYYFEFTLNPLITDADSSTTSAAFTNLFTAFKVGRIGGTGSWSPSTLTLNGSTYGVGDVTKLSAWIDVNSSPAVNYINWQGNSTNANYLNFQFGLTQAHTDTGSGQAFYQMYPLLNPTAVTAKMVVDNQTVNFTSNSFAPGAYVASVPEASSSALLLSCAAFGVARRRRVKIA